MSMTLSEFLLARIAEDEEAARAIGKEDESRLHWTDVEGSRFGGGVAMGEPFEPMGDWDDEFTYMEHLHGDFHPEESEFISRFDPARILAECEAKRAVVKMLEDSRHLTTWDDVSYEHQRTAESTLEDALCALALPYRDHPDFDPSWAVA